MQMFNCQSFQYVPYAYNCFHMHVTLTSYIALLYKLSGVSHVRHKCDLDRELKTLICRLVQFITDWQPSWLEGSKKWSVPVGID